MCHIKHENTQQDVRMNTDFQGSMKMYTDFKKQGVEVKGKQKVAKELACWEFEGEGPQEVDEENSRTELV